VRAGSIGADVQGIEKKKKFSRMRRALKVESLGEKKKGLQGGERRDASCARLGKKEEKCFKGC